MSELRWLDPDDPDEADGEYEPGLEAPARRVHRYRDREQAAAAEIGRRRKPLFPAWIRPKKGTLDAAIEAAYANLAQEKGAPRLYWRDTHRWKGADCCPRCGLRRRNNLFLIWTTIIVDGKPPEPYAVWSTDRPVCDPGADFPRADGFYEGKRT